MHYPDRQQGLLKTAEWLLAALELHWDQRHSESDFQSLTGLWSILLVLSPLQLHKESI
jgi:hypothetical protein